MNSTDKRQPSLLLRIVQFPIVRLVLLGGGLYFLMGVKNGFSVKYDASPWMKLAAVAAMAALAIAVYVAFVHYVERRNVSELSTRGFGRELGMSLLVGAVLYSVCVLILMLLGIYRIEGLNPWQYMIPSLAMALGAGVIEELIHRGVVFRIIEESLGSWIAVLTSSLIFGIVHWRNPQGTALGALFISVEAGMLLAAAFMLTRRLWLSMGFHIAWNFTQAGIFSGAVSGNVLDAGLIQPIIQGPELLTGGSFGVEASVIAFLLCTAAGITMLYMATKRGNVIQPLWKRS